MYMLKGLISFFPLQVAFFLTADKQHPDEQELQIVYRIIEAAIWYTSEEKVSLS